jgi:hypothetical protein
VGGGRPGRRAARLLAALLFLAAGCAAGPPEGAEYLAIRPADAPELVRRWAALWQGYPGLRAAVDLTIKTPARTERQAGLLLLDPRHLRVEVTTPMGLPSLVALAGPERLVLFRPFERRAFAGPATPDALARWVGAPVPVDVLVTVLAGQVPLPEDPAGVRVERAGGAHLAWERAGLPLAVWVTPQGLPGRLRVDAGEVLLVDFTWTVTAQVQNLTLTAPRRRAELGVRYISAEYAAPPPGAFELLLPADIRLEPLE